MSVEQQGMVRSHERPATAFNGYLMLLVLLAAIGFGAWLLSGGLPPDKPRHHDGARSWRSKRRPRQGGPGRAARGRAQAEPEAPQGAGARPRRSRGGARGGAAGWNS